MKRLLQVGFFAFTFGLAASQDAPGGAPDCRIGELQIGAPAPKPTSSTYERRTSLWFRVDGAKHYRSLITSGDLPFEQYIAVKDHRLVAVIREFMMNWSRDAMDALVARYGPADTPHGPWIDRSGFSNEASHFVWNDRACGIRVDAYPSTDPGDWDERTVVVWTLGANGQPRPAGGSVR